MEAQSVDELPEGSEWQYEPKWDGFRCLAFRDHDDVELMSKAGKPLTRYFPDMVSTMREIEADRFVLDGEIVVPVDSTLSFDALLLRIHPADSRVAMLARTTPAVYVAFDLLVDADGQALVKEPLSERRVRLEEFVHDNVPESTRIWLSPMTTDLDVVSDWFRSAGSGLDGIVAKRRDFAYRTGERAGMQKFKQRRTADCVVGGFRYGTKSKLIGSLLLGLYDDDGLLQHVGFTSNIPAHIKPEMTKALEQLIKEPGFTGRAPGGPSRWSTERSTEWEPLAPRLVAEVTYDHFSGGRFRHGTSLLRFRPDKEPRQCTMDQVAPGGTSAVRLIQKRAAARSRKKKRK
jgi:ATP-dependent DNA ligase